MKLNRTKSTDPKAKAQTTRMPTLRIIAKGFDCSGTDNNILILLYLTALQAPSKLYNYLFSAKPNFLALYAFSKMINKIITYFH